ncbi:MAG TPA: hypothetical protein VF461_24130 [Gemmatimonadaceae bacterium]
MNRRERGATCGEVLFTLLVFAAVVFVIWLALRGKKEPPVAATTSRYRCLTAEGGLIPLKALVMPRKGATLRESPDATSPVVATAPMFSTWFAAERKDGYLALARDPTSGKAVGWIPEQRVLLWATKEALQPKYDNPSRRRFDLWKKREDVGISGRPGYDENADSDGDPCPVLESHDGHYKVAMIWQKQDFSDVAVGTAWTEKLRVPDDVRFFYLTTRPELKADIESFAESLVELRGGSNSDHPVLQILKGNVNVRVGRHVTNEGDDVGAVRRILRKLRGPSRIADRQPAEIRRDAERMQQRLRRLRTFYEEPRNWDERGFGWLPSEYLPGN